MEIKWFFDRATSTVSYIVYDPLTHDAVVIDPVLDFDPSGGKVSFESIEFLAEFVREKSLNVHYILETHAHADHLSGAVQLIAGHTARARIGIGEGITSVQSVFKSIFNLPESFKTDGSQFNRLFKDNEEVNAGSLSFKVLFTPGHTAACVSYLFGSKIFTGDVLFMPDSGTGRCDFPGGDAAELFRSVTGRLYMLPNLTQVFVGHDYQPGSRRLAATELVNCIHNKVTGDIE